MRNRTADEAWIRTKVGDRADAVYTTPNHYDGGYEVRIGGVDFFVDYESIDADDARVIHKYVS